MTGVLASGLGKRTRTEAVPAFVRILGVLLLLLTGCSTAAQVATPQPEADVTRVEIRVPLALYVVSSVDDADPPLSSARTTERLTEIAREMNGIWAQADITFDPVTVEAIDVPIDTLRPLATSLDSDPFFAGAGTRFDVPNPGVVNGFYVRRAGQVNGFAPTGSRVFFVVDEPTVHDERVSSHEVGHIFGLHHTLEDAGRLMFSGTNGMALSEQEQEVARYAAQGLLDGVR